MATQWNTSQIAGQRVRYRATKRNVLFNNGDLSKVLQSKLQLQDLPSQKLFQGRHVTWATIKNVVNKSYIDKAVANVIKSYSPFEDTGKVYAPHKSHARIRMVGMDIPFVVQKSCVYLESEKSLAMLGKRKKLSGKVDLILPMIQNAGLDLGSSILIRRGKTFISLKTMKVLVRDCCSSIKRSILVRLIEHMERRVNEVQMEVKNLLTEIEAVEKSIAAGEPKTRKDSEKENEESNLRNAMPTTKLEHPRLTPPNEKTRMDHASILARLPDEMSALEKGQSIRANDPVERRSICASAAATDNEINSSPERAADESPDSGSDDPIPSPSSEENDQKKVAQMLVLESFGEINYKILGEVIFLNTLQLLKAAGFTCRYIEKCPSKAYFVVCKLLSERGLNISSCFYKEGKSKYAYVSVFAVRALLKTDFGPFKDKAKSKSLETEILCALELNGFKPQEMMTGAQVPAETEVIQILDFGSDFPRCPYKIKDGVLFLHRKSCFEAIGLENLVMRNTRGYHPINLILQQRFRQTDVNDCYLRTKQELYAYISVKAVFALLESQDSLLVCLEKREPFLEALLTTIQKGVIASLGRREVLFIFDNDENAIPSRCHEDSIFVHRHTCYVLLGLYDNMEASKNQYDIFEDPGAFFQDLGMDSASCFLSEEGDNFSYISIEALFALIKAEENILDSHNFLLIDIISAIFVEAPKLKTRLKIQRFKNALLSFLLSHFNNHLQRLPDSSVIVRNTLTERAYECVPPALPEPPDGVQHSQTSDEAPSDTESFSQTTTVSSSVPVPMEFLRMKSEISGNEQNGMIGDWEIKRNDDQEIRLVVNPGFGTSRKISFIHPEVAALIKYEFVILPNLSCQLFINERKVADKNVRHIFEESQRKGLLSILYQFLTMRPCFGSFNPELVETVGKGLVDCQNVDDIAALCSNVFVDTNFIGSSQTGRTYAGTVRSRNCKTLAENGVRDTCSQCSVLEGLVVNRSIFTSNALDSGHSSPDVSPPRQPSPVKTCIVRDDNKHRSQRSVWKLEASNRTECCFLCLQLQSFNTSLPHRFYSSHQATTVVKHQVKICHDLQGDISLNGHVIQKNLKQKFQDNQIGPLLDWVASLRVCVGYPDADLVGQARFVGEKMSFFPSDLQRVFGHFALDESFVGRTGDGQQINGTLRSSGCKFLATDDSDICDQCRILQEPIEFLNI